MGEISYLIRYGIMSHVGRFRPDSSHEQVFDRGQLVVIQTDRGVELGEVLTATNASTNPAHLTTHAGVGPPTDDHQPGASSFPSTSRILRAAGPEDLARAKMAMDGRSVHYSRCQRILGEGDWPWELVDVEPLLDGESTVVYYLGPHQIDAASLRARFRVECAIDIVLQPVGPDVGPEHADDDAHSHEGGGCGSCGRDGGGCHGSEPTAATGCAPSSSSHSGCSSCGIAGLRAGRSRSTA